MGAPVPAMFVDRYMSLTDQQRMKFDIQYQSEAKDPSTGFICALFGVFYFYMGDAMKNILMMVSCIVLVGFVWSIITLINSKKLVEQYNAQVAQRILSTIA
jgi:hypothetical protein